MVAKTSLKVEHHGQARKITCQQQTNQSKLTFVQTNTTHRIKQHPLSKVILKLRKLFFLVFFYQWSIQRINYIFPIWRCPNNSDRKINLELKLTGFHKITLPVEYSKVQSSVIFLAMSSWGSSISGLTTSGSVRFHLKTRSCVVWETWTNRHHRKSDVRRQNVLVVNSRLSIISEQICVSCGYVSNFIAQDSTRVNLRTLLMD